MRTIVALLSALLLAACGGGGDGDGTSTPSPVAWSARDQAEMYSAVIGTNVAAPWIYDQVCDNAGGNPSEGVGTCESMDPKVAAALQRLIPKAKFTSDFAKIDKQIIEGSGGVIWRLGPPQGSGGRTKISAAFFCGSLCAGGVTHIVEKVDGEWTETATEGPEWVS